MTRVLALAAALALAGCAAGPAPPRATPYAEALIARSSAPAPVERGVEPARPADRDGMPEPAPAPDSDRIAGDEPSIAAFLAKPFSADDLAALAVRRSDAVAAARAKLEAARTGYRQAADLDDLAALYRSYSRGLELRVGPARHRRSAGAIAPSPNVSALSGEMVGLSVRLAGEELRRVRLAVLPRARRAHAEIVHWAESRRIVGEDVGLLESLHEVMRARLETGQANQAGYLALTATLASRRTELDVLGDREPEFRARLNRLLARPDAAAATLSLAASPEVATPTDAEILVRARTANPDLRAARLRAERAAVAVRMAETMTLPRLDVGSSRFERDRAGEAGADRGPVFPDPGRMVMPRAGFGVREAQVAEMRARSAALAAAGRETERRVAADLRRALFSLTSARKRARTLASEVVPAAERALRAARGSYEGNRSGYLDLLDAARNLVRARLDRSAAVRDLSISRAEVLAVAGMESGKDEDR